MTKRTALFLAVILPLGVSPAAEWQSLFDGKTLDGWTQRGGKARYTVEDGVIVGRTVPNTPNSFLCTEKTYGDFVLELEFKVHPELNSGVQIRSNSIESYRNGRVHGYQVEIDPGLRAWSGGVYDEGRRGWLNSLERNAAARYAFKQNGWNQYRVQAIGDSIKTWINGVPAADLVDAMTQTGFIGLQVHGVGKRQDAIDVRWRNIRIKDLGRSAWEPLFDGKTLKGWSPSPGGEWKVVDGVIKGTSVKSDRRHGILVSDAKYKDFTIRVVYRSLQGNSGFYFRVDRTQTAVAVAGFQAEIDAAGNSIGGLYETAGRAWVAQPDPALVKKIYKPKDWNEMIVSAHGPDITVTVNGRQTVQLLNDRGRREGHLGLQLHGSQDMDVEFKSVELLKTPAARPVSSGGPKTFSSPVVPDGSKVEQVATGFKFTEGPATGPNGNLYFSDIPNSRIHQLDIASGKVSIHREETGRANGLMFGPNDVLIACEGGNRRVSLQSGDTLRPLTEQFKGKKLNSPNDLDLDGKGGLYFTDPRYGKNRDDMEQDIEAVYYLPRKKSEPVRIVDNLVRPNGLILSTDNQTLYVIDNGANETWSYSVQPDGTVKDAKLFAEEGGDGMTIDEWGNVYGAGGNGSHIWVRDPSGKLLTTIPVPERPSNCCFGGPEFKTLYITARKSVYRIKLNVAGTR